MDPVIFFRWVHILSGAGWLGEVIAINFVLIPALGSMEARIRPKFIGTVFPRLFRLASVLSVLSISSGFVMSYLISGWKDISLFLTTRWGLAITVGGSLGIALTAFHFIVESRLKPIASAMVEESDEADLDRVVGFLRVVPRVGLAVMIAIFLLMMYAARGV